MGKRCDDALATAPLPFRYAIFQESEGAMLRPRRNAEPAL